MPSLEGIFFNLSFHADTRTIGNYYFGLGCCLQHTSSFPNIGSEGGGGISRLCLCSLPLDTARCACVVQAIKKAPRPIFRAKRSFLEENF